MEPSTGGLEQGDISQLLKSNGVNTGSRPFLGPGQAQGLSPQGAEQQGQCWCHHLRRWGAVCSMAFPRVPWDSLGLKRGRGRDRSQVSATKPLTTTPSFSLNELCQGSTNLAAGIFCLHLLEAGNGHGMRSHHETLPGQATPRTSEHTWPDEWCQFATKPAPFLPKIPAFTSVFTPAHSCEASTGAWLSLRRWPRKILGLRISQKASF